MPHLYVIFAYKMSIPKIRFQKTKNKTTALSNQASKTVSYLDRLFRIVPTRYHQVRMNVRIMVQSKIKTCNGTWTETVTETDPWASVTKRWKEQNVSIFKIQVRGEKLLQPNKNDYFRLYGVESKNKINKLTIWNYRTYSWLRRSDVGSNRWQPIVGDIMMVSHWWQNFYTSDFFISDFIYKLSPTNFVASMCHQHRCSPYSVPNYIFILPRLVTMNWHYDTEIF